MKIILASGSPRRLEILRAHGIDPIVMPTDADETLPDDVCAADAVRTLSERKAEACFEKIKKDPSTFDNYRCCVIIGSDTVVWKDGIMGKPAGRADAFRMLDSIRNTSHIVVTGVCLLDIDTGDKAVITETTEVFCKDYSDEDINEYISLEEPYDKAGSYAIQGYFGRYIDHIEGDYENVVGLPFYRIEDALKKYY